MLADMLVAVSFIAFLRTAPHVGFTSLEPRLHPPGPALLRSGSRLPSDHGWRGLLPPLSSTVLGLTDPISPARVVCGQWSWPRADPKSASTKASASTASFSMPLTVPPSENCTEHRARQLTP
eukprot:3937609-Rhodomonas_salina.2